MYDTSIQNRWVFTSVFEYHRNSQGEVVDYLFFLYHDVSICG